MALNEHTISEAVKQLEEIKTKQELHRRQLKEQRDKTVARKHRTHRLIVRGAVAEHAMNLDEAHAAAISNERFETMLYCALNRQNIAKPCKANGLHNLSEDACGSNSR